MALVHGSADPDPVNPALHALIIGVGGYPFLPGGSGPELRKAWKFGSPGQLTSPPRSALAWVDAIFDERITWRHPVGSVDLLVSPAPADLDPHFPAGDYEVPTHRAVVKAFDAWWKRCDSHKDNVGLFVFIGHGLQGVDTLVLPADFGERASNPWPQAFNMTKTSTAFQSNAARTQLFIVDACRTKPMAAIESPSAGVPALAEPEARQEERWENNFTVLAASSGKKAHGPGHGPSYLTQALVTGLRGAAELEVGTWQVSAHSLTRRLSDLMYVVGTKNGQRPVAVNQGDEYWLCKVPEPTTDLHLGCEPMVATAGADLSWHHGKHPSRVRGLQSARRWKLEGVPAGFSTGEAVFPEGGYVDGSHPLFALPPKSNQSIPVQPT